MADGFKHIPPEPSTHGGDTIPVDMDAWERQMGYVLTRLDEIQQRALTPDDITRALQRAIADAASSPDTWAAAVEGARKATESHAAGRLWGRVAMPVIDALFWWQGPRHCERAYIAERQRLHAPPESR